MKDDDFRKSMLETLGLSSSPKDEQDAALYRLESIANKRLALAIPEMLSKDQVEEFEKMRAAGEDDKSITQWLEDQLPDYDKMIRSIIKDVAEEAASS